MTPRPYFEALARQVEAGGPALAPPAARYVMQIGRAHV
mgnify:CR=1 FL=1